ncbi:hypothetical protein AURDEDRAFT_165288 [Auricularia subglabra TFB-10046 SS5]|nr:hypothetical protein AURDEDRAFT_165288 [Auricularia subglabra TFB-10046 SS5]
MSKSYESPSAGAPTGHDARKDAAGNVPTEIVLTATKHAAPSAGEEDEECESGDCSDLESGWGRDDPLDESEPAVLRALYSAGLREFDAVIDLLHSYRSKLETIRREHYCRCGGPMLHPYVLANCGHTFCCDCVVAILKTDGLCMVINCRHPSVDARPVVNARMKSVSKVFWKAEMDACAESPDDADAAVGAAFDGRWHL